MGKVRTEIVLYLKLDPGVYKVCAPGEEGGHLQLRRSEKAPLRPHDRADGRTEHRLDAVVLVVHLYLSHKRQEGAHQFSVHDYRLNLV